jgi:hypothetical protein
VYTAIQSAKRLKIIDYYIRSKENQKNAKPINRNDDGLLEVYRYVVVEKEQP